MGGSVSFPRQRLDRGRTVIVTGGNTGIGYEIAKWIAMLGAKVIIACRSETRAKDAIATMKEDFQREKNKGTEGVIQDGEIDVQFMQLDLASLKSTKKFIDDFKASGMKLHVLVCNAGIVFAKQQYTEEDNELHFQVNYLGHFLLALHLIPLMEQSGSEDCRIVNTASFVHKSAKPFDVTKIQGKQYTQDNFDRRAYYNWSKLYQIMQMYFMNRRLKETNSNVTVLCIDPGMVATESDRNFKDICFLNCLWSCIKCCGIAKKPFGGAETAIYAAIKPELTGTRDVYYSSCKPEQTTPQTRDETKQEALLQFSLDCLKDFLTDDMKQKWAAKT